MTHPRLFASTARQSLSAAAELLGEVCGVEQRLAITGVPDLALGLPQADQQLAALRALTAARLVVELECLAIPTHGLTGCELRQRVLGGPPSVVHGLRDVAAHDRCGPVDGEFTQVLAGLLAALFLECFCYASMKPGAAGAPEILIQGVLDERVDEREASGLLCALPQQRRRNRLVEQVEQLRLGQLDDRQQQAYLEVAADDGGGAQSRARVRAEALDTSAYDLVHALRQAELG